MVYYRYNIIDCNVTDKVVYCAAWAAAENPNILKYTSVGAVRAIRETF